LIANVQIAETTSRDPLRTRLWGRLGSNSHMVVAVSMAPRFVITDIKSQIARLMTCARHLMSPIGDEPR
jgi:hypothetical protein